MSRLALAAGVLVWVGATLLLSQWGRAARPGLAERLRPFHPGADAPTRRAVLSGESFQDLFRPLVAQAGDRLAALLGVVEPVSRRLARIHSPVTAVQFRSRQMAWSGGALAVGASLAVLASAPLPLALLLVAGLPVLAFLLIEQQLVARSDRWKRSVALELPVVAEQLAMLLNAGYSLGAAVARVATRSRGCAARDLALVQNRVRQGLSEAEALREWSERAGVEAVARLVAVLTLHGESSELGRLISAEARAARRDLHRRTIETIEKRGQQVWIPVTVATLVPGVILLAVPFLAALKLFSGT